MTLTPNPFTNRGMVTDPADFIGRAEQMEEICTRLDKMESTSIVGERRIGKSSLFYHLMQTGARLIEDRGYGFFYLNLYEHPRGQFSYAYRACA